MAVLFFMWTYIGILDYFRKLLIIHSLIPFIVDCTESTIGTVLFYKTKPIVIALSVSQGSCYSVEPPPQNFVYSFMTQI